MNVSAQARCTGNARSDSPARRALMRSLTSASGRARPAECRDFEKARTAWQRKITDLCESASEERMFVCGTREIRIPQNLHRRGADFRHERHHLKIASSAFSIWADGYGLSILQPLLQNETRDTHIRPQHLDHLPDTIPTRYPRHILRRAHPLPSPITHPPDQRLNEIKQAPRLDPLMKLDDTSRHQVSDRSARLRQGRRGGGKEDLEEEGVEWLDRFGKSVWREELDGLFGVA
jgi:hypothetical protein